MRLKKCPTCHKPCIPRDPFFRKVVNNHNLWTFFTLKCRELVVSFPSVWWSCWCCCPGTSSDFFLFIRKCASSRLKRRVELATPTLPFLPRAFVRNLCLFAAVADAISPRGCLIIEKSDDLTRFARSIVNYQLSFIVSTFTFRPRGQSALSAENSAHFSV